MAVTTPSVDEAQPGGPAVSVSQAPWPTAGQSYYTVFMLGLALMFAEIDRGAMSLLIQPIKQAFHLSDSWIGFLLGPAFATFYAICGLSTAWLIDRRNRKLVLAWALGLWSAAALLSGLAQNYIQLGLARLLLGAAEAPNGPAIFSIISDSFPRKHLTRGISLMQLGAVVGNGFSLIMTGVLIALLVHVPDQHLGGLVIRWWQLVFILLGAPGLLVAVILGTTVKEPARHGVVTSSSYSMLQALAYMVRKWKVFGPFMGSAAIGGLGFGVIAWQAAFFQRTYGWAPSKVGVITGIAGLVVTPLGLLLGTWAYERFVKQGRRDAAMRVVLLGRLIAMPAALALPLMPTGELAVGLACINLLVLGATGASNNSILQIISPNQMRGQITAIFFLFFTLVGQGLSPWFIGLATDLILKDESKLRYALLGAGLLFSPASLFVLWLGRKPYAREVELIEAAEAAA